MYVYINDKLVNVEPTLLTSVSCSFKTFLVLLICLHEEQLRTHLVLVTCLFQLSGMCYLPEWSIE